MPVAKVANDAEDQAEDGFFIGTGMLNPTAVCPEDHETRDQKQQDDGCSPSCKSGRPHRQE